MKTITKYVSDDGTEFLEEGHCKNHEALCAEVAALMSRLPSEPKNDGCDFANGSGYIQHDPEHFWGVREKLLQIAQRFTQHKWLQQAIDDRATVHPSYPARIIDECCPDVLSRAFYRIYCTDRVSLREYGQPYYVEHPDKLKGGRLNP